MRLARKRGKGEKSDENVFMAIQKRMSAITQRKNERKRKENFAENKIIKDFGFSEVE